MGKKRIIGVDRGLMMLVKQARKYWRFYSPIYKEVKLRSFCVLCSKRTTYVEVDHNPPLGPRPRLIDDFPDWWKRLMFGPQEGLCKKHHEVKTSNERAMRKLRKRIG